MSATHLYDRNGEKGVSGVLAAIPQAILFALAQSDRMGALPQLYAATVPEVRGNSYVGPGFEFAGYPRRTLRNPLAYRRSTARKLWELSEQLTGVRYDFSVT